MSMQGCTSGMLQVVQRFGLRFTDRFSFYATHIGNTPRTPYYLKLVLVLVRTSL